MSLDDYIKRQRQDRFKLQAPKVIPQNNNPTPVLGDAIKNFIGNKRSNVSFKYQQQQMDRTHDLASKVVKQSTGTVKTNEFGIPDKNFDLATPFSKRVSTIGKIGENALHAETERARFQELQRLQDQAAGIKINWIPGASPTNPGAKAVASAMEAFKRGTPYVWGGNSLTKGVDCSGLVQQVYSKLGINLPRTTYEQAKSGKIVSTKELLPGDLVFYNTGSRDPNGIGRNSHVAIYVGNGQVVHAINRKEGIKVTKVNYTGSPSVGIRPW